MKDKFIKRSYLAEFTSDEEKPGSIRGVPIVFDQATDIGGMFREIIRPGAISEALLKREIKLFENHNIHGSKAMASTLIPIDKLGGMVLTKRLDRIEMDALLNLERTDSKDFYLAVRDGTMSGMSFMFSIKAQTWTDLDTDYPTRYIEEIDEIVEVSGVNYPAYKGTSISTTSTGLRSIESSENDLSVLEKARRDHLHTRSAETEQLELLKLKNKNLFIGGRF